MNAVNIKDITDACERVAGRLVNNQEEIPFVIEGLVEGTYVRIDKADYDLIEKILYYTPKTHWVIEGLIDIDAELGVCVRAVEVNDDVWIKAYGTKDLLSFMDPFTRLAVNLLDACAAIQDYFMIKDLYEAGALE